MFCEAYQLLTILKPSSKPWRPKGRGWLLQGQRTLGRERRGQGRAGLGSPQCAGAPVPGIAGGCSRAFRSWKHIWATKAASARLTSALHKGHLKRTPRLRRETRDRSTVPRQPRAAPSLRSTLPAAVLLLFHTSSNFARSLQACCGFSKMCERC